MLLSGAGVLTVIIQLDQATLAIRPDMIFGKDRKRIYVESSKPMLAITMTSERIGH